VKYRDARRDFERNYWNEIMVKHGRNVTHAARAAGVNRTDMYKRLKRAGVPTRGAKRGKWGDL